MTRCAPIALAALLATAAPFTLRAQQIPFTDPANLRGERVTPSDGRELPIDQSETAGGRGLEQMLRRLSTRASLLLIVAHPDDEDGGMLTFVSRGLGARTGTLTLNRGEGGQNAATGDFEDALGLLRTQELLSADRYLGVNQMFGTEVDFGFSKTKAESFAKWGHKRVLYDAVRAVRLYRPLVIASVFIGGVTDGHGQHQVSGEITQEVFAAAGNPLIFPELTREGILPWQPLRVFARVPAQSITPRGLYDYATGQYLSPRFTNYVTGETSSTPPAPDVVVHEGVPDALLSGPGESSRSYVQFARIGLGLQKSQIGPGARVAPAGAFDVGYHLYGTRTAALPTNAAEPGGGDPNFFSGIDTSLEGIGTLLPTPSAPLQLLLRDLSQHIDAARASFGPRRPAAGAPELHAALTSVDAAISLVNGHENNAGATARESVLHELRVKRVQLNQALTLALGLVLTADAPASDVPVHTAVAAHTRLSVASAEPVTFLGDFSADQDALGIAPGAHTGDLTLSAAHPLDRTCSLAAATSLEPTRPYFYRTDVEQPVYTLSDPSLRNAPATPPALTCIALVDYRGTPLRLAAVAIHRAGPEVTAQPVALVPQLTVALSSVAQIVPVSARTPSIPNNSVTSLTATIQAAPPTAGTLALAVGGKWRVSPATAPLRTGTATFTIAPSGPGAAAPATVSAHATAFPSLEAFRPVGYPGLPRTNFYAAATSRLVPAELALPAHRRIGYLPGTGDGVPEALASIGLPVTLLSVADLNPLRLSQFDTVVLGVRTYAAHPELHGAPTGALIAFARGGGNVVVQYQTAEFTAADAPLPLSVGRDAEKVVDETAPVRLLEDSSPLLTTPNHIVAPADFSGWIAERGHGFAATWDPQYVALTETHDPGAPAEGIRPQEPQRGGLLTLSLGAGRWTYCAFALYRQLPEAVPGAFRLFVNLVTPGFHL